jgi:hypothetical protein
VKTSSRLFGVIVVASLIVLTCGRNLLAQPSPQSDELRISIPGGGPILADVGVAEQTGPGTEPSVLFSAGVLPGLEVAPGALPGIIPPGLLGVSYIILTEPSGEPPDPTELPPVFYPAGTQNQVSDLLISGTNQTQVPPFIALISDNNPDLGTYVGAIPAAAMVSIAAETGALQDLTAMLVPPPAFPAPIGPVIVQVQSDVVPEPSTLALVALGAVPMLIARRRLCVR